MKPPTEPGWYWYKPPQHVYENRPLPVYVYTKRRPLSENDEWLYANEHGLYHVMSDPPVHTLDGQWGPRIPEYDGWEDW